MATRRDIRETIDRLRRYIEDLDVSQDSVTLLQDKNTDQTAARSNRTIYKLSIVAAIFLPLSFSTGLLGINIGRITLADAHLGVWAIAGFLTAVRAIQLLVFRKLTWL